MVGGILEKNKMLLRTCVGTCEVNGHELELGHATFNGQPYVYNPKTCRTFYLTWEEIVGLAIERGILDNPESEEAKDVKK